ncbi:UDP-N-acetylglucosamine--undecaprenyl-phosphate N-acetylglucosaminephosphotransferase [Vibrio methylphosphonaticus]|uniref:UDP-N-acetylglucosamine--undecaprenyl-phosphate N-acetylglucosaminephosphotransferase n=1 Tax=Vibrio methylphosphonaticus TaxID=2946866 RepID=UPI002029FF39|nr:UDP-N-acetylglucosamine--undecaprenyl-phosphate N-acetylglucosaminephosphotransferase [Vibrio methylphosphonaticus]MCL9775513.1 UDP-N-acetylglucosamine--undecaprenyl-phosphate N-acetylglucosaminephosphotransferase [Vibrio methylphosphonaticus]
MAWQIISVFIGTFLVLFFNHRLAPAVGLVDSPTNRKRHQGQVPLIGGLSVGMVISLMLLFSPNIIAHQTLLIITMLVLLLTGVLDDRFDLSCRIRLLVQAGLAGSVAILADIQLLTFGNAFGLGYVEFEFLAIPMTIIAVIGAINAFNMVDGIDGLLGSLAIITFTSLGILFYLEDNLAHLQLCLLFIAALLPYLALNLGFFGARYRIFMGDAGSMMIGFVVIWLLFTLTQPTSDANSLSHASSHAIWTYSSSQELSVRPVTALWLIAVPLMDMVAIMCRRIKKGHSPMTPDRGHLHHIFQRIGFSSRQTLVLISVVASCFALVGIAGELSGAAESTMFYLFIMGFALYYWLLSKIFRITAFIRLMRRKNHAPSYESEL